MQQSESCPALFRARDQRVAGQGQFTVSRDRCKQLFCLQGHEEAIYSVKFSPDGSHLLTAGSDGKIIIWDLSALTLGAPASLSVCAAVQTIKMEGDAYAAQFMDCRTVASAIDDQVVLWDIETAQKKASRTITAATDYVFGGNARCGRP
jgi:WD40 repeat protein